MDLMTIIMVLFVILWSINKGKDVGVSDTVGDVTARVIDLPSDILFPPGKTKMTKKGKSVIRQLFKDDEGTVLNFETSGLVKRMLVIHGHTDSDGKKGSNIGLGFSRALAAYREIKKYSKDIPDHVALCTHADNSTAVEVPKFKGKISKAQRNILRQAKAKNRRITIEDKLVNKFKVEE